MQRLNAWAGTERSAVAGLLLLVLLAYGNAMGGVFQFDDYNVIVDFDPVHSFSGWLADAGQGIRAMLKLSYLLNWLSGWGAAGFIAVNVLIHCATVLVVYQLGRVMLERVDPDADTSWVPWAGAALFAVQPANTEAVTYICGRSTSLMALLYLFGLWAHAKQGPREAVGVRSLVPVLCLVLALAVKETAVTFALSLLLWDLAMGLGWRAALYKARWTWAATLVAFGFFLFSDAYREAMLRSLEFNSLAGNAATQLMAMVYLARQWALPLWLNIDPDLAVQSDFSQALPALAGLLAVGLAAFVVRRKRPWLAFAVAWAVLHWLPLYLVLPRLDVANDRQLYLAIWPLGLALAMELHRALPKRLALLGLCALLVAGSWLTMQRNRDYFSETALWEQTVAGSPGKSRVHNNLGFAYQLEGRRADARREYLHALQLDPANVKARLNLRRLRAPRAMQPAEENDPIQGSR